MKYIARAVAFPFIFAGEVCFSVAHAIPGEDGWYP
jgi:hypothetical protein